ncbi:MAG: penicillin-binding protein 2 [Clostridiales bacterium]|jgi:penicillin-binding protein 2|nr:penicillin-binding protein 2 [Clostridiales bacterium]
MTKFMLKRLRVFSALVVLVTMVLTARLAWLQIYQYDHYLARAETNRMRDLPIGAPRGEIFDRNGELLVGNRPGFVVSILDLSKRDQPAVVAYLSELLEMEETDISTKIWDQRFRSFAPIRITTKPVSNKVVAQIEERRIDLPGVIVETQPMRYYTNDNLAAHALGYVGAISREQLQQMQEQGRYYRGTDSIGQSGVEKTWEELLRGQDGTLRVETNRYGRRIRVLAKEDPVPGHNLTLTLDARLQNIAEQAFLNVIAQLQEEGNDQVGKGAVVAMNPNTGEILAMVSLPSYNPNTFSENFSMLKDDRDNPLMNRTISGAYPIGSTYKMVGAAAALEEGIISEQSIITCTGRKVFFPNDPSRGCFNNAVHGALNVVQALAKSCNIFFFELGKRTGIDHLTAYAEDFGFSRTTGLNDLEGERTGSLLRREEGKYWAPGNVLTAAIGQGHTITPLQLANYGAMLANGGIHYRPFLVREVTDKSGETIVSIEPEIINQLEYKDATWAAIHRGMEAVTLPGGTASSMRDLPVKVAGKTGSAQVNLSGTQKAHSLFVGYAPADAPEIALAVIVEHGGLGGQAAVPVAKQIFDKYYSISEE